VDSACGMAKEIEKDSLKINTIKNDKDENNAFNNY
jgi:hypothetical protein